MGSEIAAIGSIAGGLIGSMGASDAADTQAESAANANALQMQMFNKVQQNLQPFIDTGTTNLGKASDMAGTFKFDPTQAQLQQTPGYQFTLNQGLKAANNSAAARGLANSGAALKGAAGYATGLADNTFQNQFGNAMNTFNTNFGSYKGLADLGENAAAHAGNAAQGFGEMMGNNITGAGNAIGASQIAGSNALASGISGAGNSLMAGMYGNNSGGGNSFNAGAYAQGLPWSDIRLKENIVPLGEENGHAVYEFNYTWSPIRYIGVMAQEVLEKVPDAVTKLNDHYAVDYGKIGVEFRRA